MWSPAERSRRWQAAEVLRWLALLLVLIPTRASAFEVPALRGPVNDYAGVLSAAARDQLAAELSAFQQRTGHQLAVLTVRSLDGGAIEVASMKVAEAWQLGDAKRNDGLLFMIATADRRMRIEVGYGLEGLVPDAIASRIIAEVAQPAFRRGDMEEGITASMKLLMKSCESGGGLPQRLTPVGTGEKIFHFVLGSLVSLLVLGFYFTVAFLLIRAAIRFVRGKKTKLSHASGFVGSSSSDSHSSSSSFSSSSSDSGYSGGGGSFGGGGASGSW